MTEEELAQRILILTERLENLEDGLLRISTWCGAYPEDLFTPLSEEEIKVAGMVLKAGGIDIGRIHAQWARHLLAGVDRIAKAALTSTEPEGEDDELAV